MAAIDYLLMAQLYLLVRSAFGFYLDFVQLMIMVSWGRQKARQAHCHLPPFRALFLSS